MDINADIEEKKNINKYNCCVRVNDWIIDDEGYYKAEIPVAGLKEKNIVTVHTMDDAMMDHGATRNTVNKTLRQILELGYFFVFTNDGSITCRWRWAQKPECDIYFRLEEEIVETKKMTFIEKLKFLFGKQEKKD